MAKKKTRRKSGKGKGGSVWPANFTQGVCGLVPADAIQKDDPCMFLTCRGSEAMPHAQIVVVGTEEYEDRNGDTRERTVRESLDGVSFRSVPTGERRCRRNSCRKVYDYARTWCSCRSKTQMVFKWQENKGTAAHPKWHDVTVWEKVVLVKNAEALGYHIPKGRNGEYIRTVAAPGTRTTGYAHQTAQAPESPLMDLARVALEEEAAEEAAPSEPEGFNPEGEAVKDDLDELFSLL